MTPDYPSQLPPLDPTETWLGHVAGYPDEEPTSHVAVSDTPHPGAQGGAQAAAPALAEIAILAAEGRQTAASGVASVLNDLGRISMRRLARLSDIGSRPPSLVILVGSSQDLLGTLSDLAQLRSEVDERALPVLALGLATSEGDILRLLAAGANEVLPLPPRQGELRAKVRRLIAGTARTPVLAPTRGVRVAGRYRIRGPLGSGAYGSVYDAWDELGGRQVAVKVLPAAGPASRERFLREAYTLAALRDRHLAPVYDVFEEDNHLFLVSELVRGPTLRKLILERGPLSAAETVELMRGLSRALLTLERSGLVHRDIKPANVILRGGRVEDPVLVDFGLAKRPFDRAVSSAAYVMGTPGYMAPETISGNQQHDGRADLFSLGMLARYALCGDEYMPELFGSDLVRHMLDNRVEIPDSECPRLDALLRSLTDPDPDQRVRSARDLLLLLDAIATPEEPA